MQVGTSKETTGQLQSAVDRTTLAWRTFRRDAFWQQIPAWRKINDETFLDFRWQEQNSITSAARLAAVMGDLISRTFLDDFGTGLRNATMSVRVSPYLLGLVDWSDPYRDPIRRQFLPMGSEFERDHPMLKLDPLQERADSPVFGLTHRYPDKVLFLALDTCPVYCRCCTRSYSVGVKIAQVPKVGFPVSPQRWESAFSYIADHSNVEDIVVSGGDAYRLSPDQLRTLGHRLLDIPHIRRIRFATKGLAVQPMKIITHREWLDALTEVVEKGRQQQKDVCVHSHFNHPKEITGVSQDAMSLLFARGIVVRNQSVLQRGVNDDPATMIELCRRLSSINVHPYYVYVHDLVPGTEDLRTTISGAIRAEKLVRGTTAGFNTPTFVVDTPGGGGKRDIHSYEYYDRETGISIYSAPSVKPGQLFAFFDPMRNLSAAIQQVWRNPSKSKEMISAAFDVARQRVVDHEGTGSM